MVYWLWMKTITRKVIVASFTCFRVTWTVVNEVLLSQCKGWAHSLPSFSWGAALHDHVPNLRRLVGSTVPVHGVGGPLPNFFCLFNPSVVTGTWLRPWLRPSSRYYWSIKSRGAVDCPGLKHTEGSSLAPSNARCVRHPEVCFHPGQSTVLRDLMLFYHCHRIHEHLVWKS